MQTHIDGYKSFPMTWQLRSESMRTMWLIANQYMQ